jgi:predicted metalloprotease
MFRRGARLDPGQVRDIRGSRIGGRGGAVAGGGGIALVAALIYVLLGGNPADLAGVGGGGGGQPNAPESSTLAQQCRTGEDANQRQDCRILGVVNSVQAYWKDAFAESGEQYRPADTVIFTDQVSTGCGTATSAVGPFYCPTDQLIYIDLGFYEQLEQRFGAEGGPFAEAYVVAHEYGHHVQNLTGYLRRGQEGGSGPESGAVRVELMADCLAGVWANNAEATGFLNPLSDQLIQQAVDAAQAVGDDRIQERTQGQVNRETWSHGSSEQRQAWFQNGYQKGNFEDCDTFQADIGG